MKLNKLTDNLFLKLLSIFAAIVLWVVVVVISDGEVKDTYSTEVILKNTDVVTENGKVYWVEDGSNFVKLTVRARRSVMEDLKPTDFIVTADMEKDLKYDSQVEIRVECKNKNIKVEDNVTLSRNNVIVSIEDSATEQFPVHVSHMGSINSGLMVGSMVPEQTIIKVTGPVSIVERIKEVKAVVDVTGLPATSVKNCALKLYDGDGDQIDTTYLSYVGKSDGIDVTVSMLNTKTVPLVFSYFGTPAENYEVADVDWKPETIEVAGNSEVLAALTSLRVPAEAVNVDGISEELQLIIDITEYLPSGVILKDETSASVLVIVEVKYTEPVNDETVQENDSEEQTEKPEKPSQENTGEDTTGETENNNQGTGDQPGNTSGDQSESENSDNESNLENEASGEPESEGTPNNKEKETGENDSTENNS